MSDLEVSVVIPVLNEVESLRVTIQAVLAGNAAHIHEIVVVACERTSADVRDLMETLRQQHPGRIVVVEQSLPGLGGALRRGIDATSGTHVITMYSDLESDPSSVSELIRAAERAPDAVINASRWLSGSAFDGYGPVKLMLNKLFQLMFATLFRTAVTDFTFGYRLYPARVIKGIVFHETGHSFVFESLLQMVVRRVAVVEIPTRWTRRREGRSGITIGTYARYVPLGFRTWVAWIAGSR